MGKKLLFATAIVMTLTLLMPSAALAAKPVSFEASGVITSIELPGDVVPAGQSDRWRVIERDLGGIFQTFPGTQGNVPFNLTYQANVEIATQAGNLHGILTAGDYVMKVNGTLSPIYIGPYPALGLSGHWTLKEDGKGQGSFEGWAIPALDEYGHVIGIYASSFTLNGQWQP